MAWTIPYDKLLKHLKTIDDHTDVQIIDPLQNQVLGYDAALAKWVNMTVPPAPYTRAATRVVASSEALDTVNADYICDGTNDQIEINKAIEDLPPAGGRVLLTDGTFYLSDSVGAILKNNVTLQGQGLSTRLFLTAGVNKSCIVVGDEATALSGIVIRDMVVDGNRAAQTATCHCIDFKGASGYEIRESALLNVFVINGYTMGLRAYYVPRMMVSGCFADNAGTCGFDVWYTENPILFLLISKDAGAYGYRMAHVKYAVLSTAIAINAGVYGLMLSASHNISVGGCVFKGGGYGMIASGTGITISNCAFTTGTQMGAYLYAFDKGSFVGNTIIGYGGHGIYIYSSLYSTFTGNNVQDCGGVGVYIYDAASTRNLIDSNTSLGNAGGNFIDNGTATLVGDNVFVL